MLVQVNVSPDSTRPVSHSPQAQLQVDSSQLNDSRLDGLQLDSTLCVSEDIGADFDDWLAEQLGTTAVIFMITGAGSKRPAPDELKSAADLTVVRSTFNTAVKALVQKWSPADLKSALTALGPHVNLRRMEGSGCLALHAALAKHVMPDRYPRLVDAVEEICGGKHQRTAETHSAAVSRLIKQLGGHQAITDAISQCSEVSSGASSSQSVTLAPVRIDRDDSHVPVVGSAAAAACSLVMLGDQPLQQVHHVSVVVGTTGREDRPVAVRLGLPTTGLLPAGVAISPPLSPPGLDTLDLDDLMCNLGDDLTPVAHDWCNSDLMGWLNGLTESGTGHHKRARAADNTGSASACASPVPIVLSM